ncbi:PREDICTED: protein Wnt-6 [Acanthisitta chloris]|uniref:protein Wnt-6 n=1 Tax=Acanthisitta chloris TaxID=57068 RepID=UPI0004F0DDFF|nr:PREDICTED: protein Wnt-6 [Acanthisitta chloris]
MDPNSICRKTKRLAGKQAELCQLEPEIVQEVAKGTKLGVRECQYQFRFRRWNCTSHSKYFRSCSRAVRSYMRTECKCHGLSGSCTLRTCWRKMPHFREVGDRLLERFNGAFKVMGGNDGKTLIPVGDNIKPPDKQDLIYSADSPDFCSANRKTGSLGTRGRVCNSTAMDTSGCDLLCCGRGHRDETVVLEENCLCRFHWCCVVQCRKCSVRQELSLCI